MKIYFAASIRGGRGEEDIKIYNQIIELLQSYGEVLTVYMGSQNLTSAGETTITNKKVYDRDVAWLESADVLVAEVTTPSLGVGYEIGYAEKLGKKILSLYRESTGKKLSNMISGNKNITVRNYQTFDEIPIILEEFFK